MGFKLLINRDKCIGCHSCTVACKLEHNLPPYPSSPPEPEPKGPAFIRVKQEEPGRFSHIVCRHCERAPCIEECPTGALVKGPWGMTQVLKERCVGCGVCIKVCPFEAPQLLPDGTIGLCDLCLPLRDEGLLPACQSACPAGCIEIKGL